MVNEKVFHILSQEMAVLGLYSYELFLCGGSAMRLFYSHERTTIDVDSLKRLEHGIRSAAEATRKRPELEELELPENWLNERPCDLVAHDLPEGWESRARDAGCLQFGTALMVYSLAKSDLIFSKVLANVLGANDGRGQIDLQDLKDLKCSKNEIYACQGTLASALSAAGHSDPIARASLEVERISDWLESR